MACLAEGKAGMEAGKCGRVWLSQNVESWELSQGEVRQTQGERVPYSVLCPHDGCQTPTNSFSLFPSRRGGKPLPLNHGLCQCGGMEAVRLVRLGSGSSAASAGSPGHLCWEHLTTEREVCHPERPRRDSRQRERWTPVAPASLGSSCLGLPAQILSM